MHSLTVVVAQADCVVAEHLASNLHAHFKNVVVARDLDEVRSHMARDPADIIVLDLDMAELADVRGLLNDFRNTGIVCTHRVPDEEMWKLCLDVGALDCCSCTDLQGIVRAARHHSQTMTVTAA